MRFFLRELARTCLEAFALVLVNGAAEHIVEKAKEKPKRKRRKRRAKK